MDDSMRSAGATALAESAKSESQDILNSKQASLERYYVAVNLKSGGGEQIFSLTPHFATAERAAGELPKWLDGFPAAGVLSVTLSFDLKDRHQRERYEAFRSESSAREMMQ